MIEPSMPNDEAERLKSLKKLNILDTPREERFDRICRIAQKLLNVDMTLVSLIDQDRQWFKAAVGLDAIETPRNISFCGHAIQSDQTMIVNDTTKDNRFFDNPLVAGNPNIRFYAGRPLKGPDDYKIGTLCVIDRKPREFTNEEKLILEDLSKWVELELFSKDLSLAQEEAITAKRNLQDQQFALDQSAIVVITDVTGKINYVNDQFCEISKYSREELIGQDHRIINSGFHPKEFIKDLWRTIANGKIWRGEICNRAKDGNIYWVDTTIVPFLDRNSKPYQYLAIRYDITLRKKQEEQLDKALKAKSEFISLVSHELRTPMTTIKGSVEVVADGLLGSLNEKQKKFMDTVLRNINRLSRLINNVLDFQKFEAGHMEFHSERFDLNQLVLTIVEDFKIIAQDKGLKIIAQTEPGELFLIVDQDKVSQILINFLNNAIKFSDQGSITVKVNREDSWVRLSVIDQGPGIKKEDQSKIFQAFQQISNSSTFNKGGTGLGLSICHKIIEYYQGEIGVESEIGQGATFYFTLPIKT